MKASFVIVGAVLVIAVAALVMAIEEQPRAAGPVRRYRVIVPDPQLKTDDAIPCPGLPMAPLAEVPKIVHRVEPQLTAEARRHRISGTVIVRVGIRPDGSVGGVCVLKPLPAGLSTAAVEAVRQWRFEPRAENAIADVPVHFAPSTTF